MRIMNYSPDPVVDGDPEETKEPLLEFLKTKSTQRKTIAVVCGFYGMEEGKIYTEKVNTRPCRFGSQRKVSITWSGKVKIYTAQGYIRGSKEKDLHGSRDGVRPAFGVCDPRLGSEVLTGGKLSCRLGLCRS